MYDNYVSHSWGPWKKHKYIKKVNGRYYYEKKRITGRSTGVKRYFYDGRPLGKNSASSRFDSSENYKKVVKGSNERTGTASPVTRRYKQDIRGTKTYKQKSNPNSVSQAVSNMKNEQQNILNTANDIAKAFTDPNTKVVFNEKKFDDFTNSISSYIQSGVDLFNSLKIGGNSKLTKESNKVMDMVEKGLDKINKYLGR